MLGTVDFAAAPSFEALPGGRYPGQTKSYEEKPTKSGDSTNVVASFVLQVEDDDGAERTRTVSTNWNLKPQSLWRIKRDLIAMGADPTDFESNAVNLKAILDDLFGPVPTPVWVTLSQREYTPDGGGESRITNDIVKVEAREPGSE